METKNNGKKKTHTKKQALQKNKQKLQKHLGAAETLHLSDVLLEFLQVLHSFARRNRIFFKSTCST